MASPVVIAPPSGVDRDRGRPLPGAYDALAVGRVGHEEGLAPSPSMPTATCSQSPAWDCVIRPIEVEDVQTSSA